MRFPPAVRWKWFRSGKILTTALALLLFAACFSVGFFSAFPDRALQQRVLSEVNSLLPAGHRLEAETVSLDFPLTLHFTKAHLLTASDQIPDPVFTTVEVTPTLASLIGSAGLSIAAQSEYGRLAGSISRSGEIDLLLQDGSFDLPVSGLGELRCRGEVASVSLVGQLQGGDADTLEFRARIGDVRLSGVRKLGLSQDELSLGQLTAELSGSGRVLTIEQLALSGGAVDLTGNGGVVLQQPFSASRLDLKLKVRAQPGADAGLKTLLELLGPAEGDGSRALQLRGRLLAPQLK